MNEEISDSAEAMEAKETAHSLPLGFIVLFVGLVLFGLYYFFTFSPVFTGWTQVKELEEGLVSTTANNMTHTIAYTAIPAVVLLLMAIAMAKRKPVKK
jgi:ABC-type Fe3+ transport system permease subunit